MSPSEAPFICLTLFLFIEFLFESFLKFPFLHLIYLLLVSTFFIRAFSILIIFILYSLSDDAKICVTSECDHNAHFFSSDCFLLAFSIPYMYTFVVQC